MSVRWFLLILLLQVSFVGLEAQVTYDRNSLSVVALDYGGNHSSDLLTRLSSLSIPEKFCHNPVMEPILSMGTETRPFSTDLPDILQYLPYETISKKLEERNIAREIISYWFNRQDDGSFDLERLKNRGLYNASDNAFIAASASKRGQSVLMDMGLKLVDQSHVLVFDFYSIQSMKEFYEQEETPIEDRNQNGFKVKAKAYLFKLDFSEEVATDFFNSFWIEKDDGDIASKIDAFEQKEFRLIPLSHHYVHAQSTQYNSGHRSAPKVQKPTEELFDLILQDLMGQAVTQIENTHEAFRVKAMINRIKPIAAKIGLKEGLQFDQRYFVYENRMRRNGTIKPVRKAVVKSYKVQDNLQDSEGDSPSSEFYQIAGGKVDDAGMYLVQKNDVGFNLFLGYAFQGMEGYTGRLEYYLSKGMGSMIPPGKSGKWLRSFKMHIEAAYFQKTYEDVEDYPFTFTRVSLGIGKDYYPFRFMHWGWFVGYGLEFADWEVEDITYDFETPYLESGLRLGINLAHNVQLLGSVQYNFFWLTTIENSFDDEVEMVSYDELFDDRIGIGVTLGIRFMF